MSRVMERWTLWSACGDPYIHHDCDASAYHSWVKAGETLGRPNDLSRFDGSVS